MMPSSTVAEPLDRAGAGPAVGAGDPTALRRRELAFQLTALLGQLQEALPAVLRAVMLDDEPLADPIGSAPG